jgi:hypothetical protein
MNRYFRIGLAFGCAAGLLAGSAYATPSTHVWTPSTDIQADGVTHITYDSYIPSQRDGAGNRPDTLTDLGLEQGVWFTDKLGMELGIDSMTGLGPLDSYPLYFNAKIGAVEDAYFEYMPAIAFGGYNFGTEHDKTDQNIFFVKAARTIKAGDLDLGRVSVGGFWGNDKVLVDSEGKGDENGVMLTWERTMKEFSDRLWVCVDWQSSESGVGALAPGFAWKFADNVAMIFGYVMPNNDDFAETFTVQLDVDFSVF